MSNNYRVQAVIAADDQTSNTIKKINANLKQLAATMKKINSLNVNSGNLGKTGFFDAKKLIGAKGALDNNKKATNELTHAQKILLNNVMRTTNALNDQNAALKSNAKLQRDIANAAPLKRQREEDPQRRQRNEDRRSFRNDDDSRSRRGKTWAESNAVDRVKWRAGTAATYGAFNRIDVGARGAGQGIAEGSSQRTASSMVLNNKAAERMIERSSELASDIYQNVSRSSVQEVARESYLRLDEGKKNQLPDVVQSIAKSISLLTISTGNSKTGEDAVRKLLKAADASGQSSNSKDIKDFLEYTVKAAVFQGKDFNPQVTSKAFAGSRNARFGLDNEAKFDLVSLVEDFQGDAGASMRQFYERMTSNTIAKKDIAAQKKAGLRDSEGKVVERELFQKNFSDWVEKVLGTKLRDEGIDPRNKDNIIEIEAKLAEWGLRQEGRKLPVQALLKRDEIVRNRNQAKNMNTSDQFVQGLKNTDIRTAHAAAGAQFKNAADAFTRDFQGAYTKVVSGIADLANFAANNPKAPKELTAVIGAGALAAGFFFKEGIDAVNNKLTVSNVALGVIAKSSMVTAANTSKMAITSSIPAVGGVAGTAGKVGAAAAGLAGIKVAAVAAVAYGAYKLIANAEEKRNERIAKDPVEKYREELSALEQSEYEPMNGVKIYDYSEQIKALRSKIQALEVNQKIDEENLSAKYLLDDRPHFVNKYGNDLYEHNMVGKNASTDLDYNKYDQDGGTALNNIEKLRQSQEGIKETALKMAESASSLPSKIAEVTTNIVKAHFDGAANIEKALPKSAGEAGEMIGNAMKNAASSVGEIIAGALSNIKVGVKTSSSFDL